MKFKSLFLLGLASVAALFSSCVKEADINAPKFAAQIKASEDGIRQDTVAVEGGEVVIELLASQAWSATVTPGTSLDNVDDITVEPASGSASSSIVEVVVKVPANKDNDRSVKVSFIGSTYSAAVSFIQKGELGERLLECSVSDFIKKPVDASIYYLLTGEVGAISNEKYGNFNIIDPQTREEILIYGLGVKEDLGKQYVFQEYGIQEGDLITIASTRGAYGTTQEGMNSYYISHKKSEKPSIKLGLSEVVGLVGESFNLPVISNLVTWTLSSDVEWLSFEPSSGSESTTVVVSVSDAGEGDTATITLSAEGLESVTCAVTRTNIQDATAEEINAAEDGKVFRVTGIVSSIANTKYGNLYIKDYTGEVYVYGTNNFAEEGIVEGDVITVVGSKSSHNGAPQMKNVDVEKHYSIKDTKVSDFRAAEDNKEVYYRLTGKVTRSTEESTKFDLEEYGNFALEDETGNVYVYGVRPAWGSPKGQFGPLGVKEGDTITIIAYKTTYKELVEADGCVYISHEAGETPEPSFSVDGKQWVFEWQMNEETTTTAVLDFGVFLEGQFTFAYDWSVLDPESYAGIYPLYTG
ncbi:MAG: BACON domain-containing protein, partial [Candidatus Cryptobacteroides sp.]